jgi:hypothetical protein
LIWLALGKADAQIVLSISTGKFTTSAARVSYNLNLSQREMSRLFRGRHENRQSVAALALLLFAMVGLSGCPALMIPGLGYSAYQAYKYQKGATSPSPGSNAPPQSQVKSRD